VVVRVLLLLLFGLERQVDVDAALRERQRGHEDDQEHEEHVDERRDVHVRAGVRDRPRDDFFGAEMLVCVRHRYCPFFALSSAPGLRSVMSAMFSICALRSASMASMIAAYFASLSPFR